jgi:hypothetical protein
MLLSTDTICLPVSVPRGGAAVGSIDAPVGTFGALAAAIGCLTIVCSTLSNIFIGACLAAIRAPPACQSRLTQLDLPLLADSNWAEHKSHLDAR